MATWSPDPERIPWLEVVANATFTAAPIVAVDEDGRPVSVTPMHAETSDEKRRWAAAQLRRPFDGIHRWLGG